MEAAKKGIITPEMEIVAAKEDMDVERFPAMCVIPRSPPRV